SNDDSPNSESSNESTASTPPFSLQHFWIAMQCSLESPAQLLHHALVYTDELNDYEKQLEIGLGIAQGMQHLHGLAVLHRNLTTHSVTLDSQGVPMLFNYGLDQKLPGYNEGTMRAEIVCFWAPELIGSGKFSQA